MSPVHATLNHKPLPYSYSELVAWSESSSILPPIGPVHYDYHRLQIERFIFDHRHEVFGPCVDIGGEWHRPYFGGGELLLNTHDYSTPSHDTQTGLFASVTALPFPDASIATVICTETLEHVANLFRAISEIQRVLRPGGLFLATTPFAWPPHGNDHFGDYWRLTPQAWSFLLADFAAVTITPTVPSPPALPHFIAAMEADQMYGELPTGYLVHATR